MEYKKNDLVTVYVEDIGTDGEGIGKIDGFTLFIKDAVIGDTVQARVLKLKKQYGYARIEKVLTPSPFRVQPKCPIYRQCGGCQLQAMDYSRQLEYKENKVKNHLTRIGGFEEQEIDQILEPIVGMENPYHYRNKAQYPVGTDKEGNLITGFYAGRTHSIIPQTECFLGVTENKDILESILDYMRENRVTAYNEEAGKGLVRHILIRTGFTSKEIMVCLILNASHAKELVNQESLIERLQKFPGMTSISMNFNQEKTNVIMGSKVKTIWGSPTITDTLHLEKEDGGKEPLTFKISPLSFYQVNPVQTEKLYGLALEYAGLTGKETVWDLYCGIGTISLFMAKRAKKVYGIEIIPQAILDARENAERNSLSNVEFFVGRAEEVLPEKYEKEGIRADVIVVDPPRKGCDEACLATMLKMAPERIVYVSCDSATLARDLRVLCDGGYEIVRGRAVDQFPGTVHVESVIMMIKCGSKDKR